MRWWHHKLLDGTLLDPASCTTTDMNSPLLTTRKGVRLDAVLVSDTIWHALTPTGCSTRTYPSAGDHKAVAAVFSSSIQDGSDHREYTGSIQHWHTGTFNAFQKHMTKWSRQTSLSGSPQERYEASFTEIHQFVQNHRPKAPQLDAKEEQFRTACKCAPTSQRALKDWGDYMGRKQAIASHKALRRFHKSAVKSARTFYQDMKIWMHTPFQMAQPQPTKESMAKHLPHFAGDPPWDPAAMCSLLRQSLTPQHGFRAAAPQWDQFLKALGRPKRKVAGPDGVAPHLLGWLPLALQWELYLCIVSAWNTGTMPKQWTSSRVSLLYKKGSPASALRYQPISVSGCMYTLFASLLLQAMERPLNQALSPEQAGARKGHTTSAQALNLWSTLLQSDNPSYLCLLDVAKAFPSTPHAAILQALHCVGAPAHLLNLVEQIYRQPMNECGGFTYRVHRGIKEGCPLSPALFTLVYQSFHGTLQREFPDVDFFIYVDDIAFVARSES